MGGPSSIGPPSVGGSSLGGPPAGLQRSLRGEPGQPSETAFRACTLTTPECPSTSSSSPVHQYSSSTIQTPAHTFYRNATWTATQPINRYQTLPHRAQQDVSLEPRPNRGSTPVPCPGHQVPRGKSTSPPKLGPNRDPSPSLRLSPSEVSSNPSATLTTNQCSSRITNGVPPPSTFHSTGF